MFAKHARRQHYILWSLRLRAYSLKYLRQQRLNLSELGSVAIFILIRILRLLLLSQRQSYHLYSNLDKYNDVTRLNWNEKRFKRIWSRLQHFFYKFYIRCKGILSRIWKMCICAHFADVSSFSLDTISIRV